MMDTIRRIIVTGDMLRVNHAGSETQSINIRWLYHLIQPALKMLSNLPVQMLLHERTRSGLAFEIYRSNALEPTLENWADLYEREPTARDLAWIQSAFEDALVVAFELPEIVRRSLVLLGIPYIDLTVHPARFLDDIAFGVRSNIKDIGSPLRPWVLTDPEIRIGAGLAQATLSRLPLLAGFGNIDNLALFACQTGDDKVLIRNRKFMRTEDFLDEFAAMSARHNRILVKRHPYARGTSAHVALTRLFPNAVEIDANIYQLLIQPGITHVYSITSSASIEAGYFGKQGKHLAPYPYVFSEDRLSDVEYLQIRPAFHLPQFWAPLFAQIGIDTAPPPPVPSTLLPNRMRMSLRNFWGADIFVRST